MSRPQGGGAAGGRIHCHASADSATTGAGCAFEDSTEPRPDLRKPSPNVSKPTQNSEATLPLIFGFCWSGVGFLGLVSYILVHVCCGPNHLRIE